MSVNVCVLRYDSTGVEIARYNNQNITPPIPWVVIIPNGGGYRITIDGKIFYMNPDDKTYVGASKTYSLPKAATTFTSPTLFYTTFLLETGYVTTVAKSIDSSDISVSVRATSDPASTEKTVYLTGETGYYHTSVVEGSKYRFVGWYNGATLVSTNAIISQTITADLTLTATYEQYKWTLETVGSANGNAYIGDSPSTLTTALYETAQTVSIRAIATNELYKFSKWTIAGVDYSTSPTISVETLEEDSTYTAVFIPISYTLNVTSDNNSHGTVAVLLGGSVQLTQTGLTVSSGVAYADPVVNPVVVEVRATPVFGYYFTGWYIGASLESSLANYTFSMPEANVSIEARFSVLSTATLTVTKTKGVPGDTADAKDMGAVSLYHLESVLDLTSAIGTATLVASLYTTLQYKLTPTPGALYQFDGWYKTEGGSEVLITTGGIYVVDGINLYITPTTTSAIPVNAQFRARTLCTIAPVASDSSTYVTSNAAETAGCTCTITDPAPDSTETGDKWLSGQTITIEAVQAVGWELRQWIVKLAASPYTVLVSKSKGDVGFGQTYAFNLTANCQVVARSVYTLPADQMQIQALHKTGQAVASGTLEIHPCGDNYIELTNGVTASVDVNSVCEVTAIPANGYKFIGWRLNSGSSIVSANPVYSFEVTASAIYYAEFAATAEQSLLLFEGGTASMLASWRGRINISNMPGNFSCARVYADGYPVAIDIGAAESPSSPLTAIRVVRSITNNQSPIRLPLRRPEKYSMIGFEANTIVNAISVATSMEGLKNG